MSLFAKGLLADVLEAADAGAELRVASGHASRDFIRLRFQHVVGDLEHLRDSVSRVVAAFGASFWKHRRKHRCLLFQQLTFVHFRWLRRPLRHGGR